MPDFSTLSTCTKPYEIRLGSVTTWSFLPTLKPEDPFFEVYPQVLRAHTRYMYRYACARRGGGT